MCKYFKDEKQINIDRGHSHKALNDVNIDVLCRVTASLCDYAQMDEIKADKCVSIFHCTLGCQTFFFSFFAKSSLEMWTDAFSVPAVPNTADMEREPGAAGGSASGRSLWVRTWSESRRSRSTTNPCGTRGSQFFLLFFISLHYWTADFRMSSKVPPLKTIQQRPASTKPKRAIHIYYRYWAVVSNTWLRDRLWTTWWYFVALALCQSVVSAACDLGLTWELYRWCCNRWKFNTVSSPFSVTWLGSRLIGLHPPPLNVAVQNRVIGFNTFWEG